MTVTRVARAVPRQLLESSWQSLLWHATSQPSSMKPAEMKAAACWKLRATVGTSITTRAEGC